MRRNSSSAASGKALQLEFEAIDLAVSPDQKLVACMEADGTCRVFELGTGQEVARRRFEKPCFHPVAFYADSERLLVGWVPGSHATFWSVRDDVLAESAAEEVRNVRSPTIAIASDVIAVTSFGESSQTTSLYPIGGGAVFELPLIARNRICRCDAAKPQLIAVLCRGCLRSGRLFGSE